MATYTGENRCTKANEDICTEVFLIRLMKKYFYVNNLLLYWDRLALFDSRDFY